jgi:hypothetical protein
MQYGHDKNYMDRWLDRPLLRDPSMADKNYKNSLCKKSFLKMVEFAKMYEIDGFCIQVNNVYPRSAWEFLKEYDKDFQILPELMWGVDSEKHIKSKEDGIAESLKHDRTFRINGKIIVTAWAADNSSPEAWEKALKRFREKLGNDFCLLLSLEHNAGDSMNIWMQKYLEGSLTEAEKDRFKNAIRRKLDFADGIYFTKSMGLFDQNRKFSSRALSKFLLPTLKEILSEEKYKEKLLAVDVKLGYFQASTGSFKDEDGTKALRDLMSEYSKAKPDVIVLSEWDEVNENTSFRPTIYNSYSTQRIMKHFMRKMKGLPPAPNPGDDLSIPDLCVSYRKRLVLGEKLKFEFLNIPDSKIGKEYKVKLFLKDIDGNVIKNFPEQSFDSAKLEDFSVIVPSEELADHIVVLPSLVISGYSDKKNIIENGLHYIELLPGSNYDCKWVKQPIRDLLSVKKADFALRENAGNSGAFLASCKFETDELVAQCEILDNDHEACSYDRNDSFLRNNPDYVLVKLEWRSWSKDEMKGILSIKNGYIERWWLDFYSNRENEKRSGGRTERIKIKAKNNNHNRAALLAIPRKQIDSAILECKLNSMEISVPLKKIIKDKIYATTKGKADTLTFSLYTRQPDAAFPANEQSIDFNAEVFPDNKISVYHARLVSQSGKIYRSKPVIVFLGKEEKDRKVAVNVFSESKLYPVEVSVSASRIPCLEYDFSPERGSIFYTDYGRMFWGMLGGRVDTSTEWGDSQWGVRGEPFVAGKRNYPPDAMTTSPERVDEDGSPCLRFNGNGNYIIFPLSTLPINGSYTVSFSIKPEKLGKQILLCHNTFHSSSLTVFLDENSNLCAKYASRDYSGKARYYNKIMEFSAKLKVLPGEWRNIKISYDQKNLQFKVDDKVSGKLFCSGPGFQLGFLLFGGFGVKDKEVHEAVGCGEWFKGLLRSFKVVHMAQDLNEKAIPDQRAK